MINKKIYRPDELGWIMKSILFILSILITMSIGVCLVCLKIFDIVVLSTTQTTLSIILLIIAPSFGIPEAFSTFQYSIKIYNGTIYMNGDWIKLKKWRIQHPVEVSCDQIKKIFIVESSLNSSCEKIDSQSKKLYLVLVSKANKEYRLYVNHFTDYKLAEMIDDIVAHIVCSENNEYDGRMACDILLNNTGENDDYDKWLLLLKEMEEKPHDEDNAINLTKEQVIELIKPKLELIKSKYKVTFFALYGGFVKGLITSSSDIDFLVSFDSSLLDCEKGEKNRELKEYLASLLNAEVDLINFDHALKNLDISEMENVLIFIKWE